jgi:hypothetical protein
VAISDIDSSLVDVERTGSTSGLRSEGAGPLLGLAAAAEEKQRETALGACHVVTVTPPVLRQANPELRASALREQLLESAALKLRGVIRVQYGNLV